MGMGKMITFEGGEGSGKSTQMAFLARSLERAGVDVLTTREPGGTEGAEQIRALLVHGAVDRWPPMSEALMHFAARVDHLEQNILPALDGNTWVLCDRFTDSTLAYQGGGHGLGLDEISVLQQLAIGTFRPDLTFVFDIGVEEGLARAFGRVGSEDRYERMDVDFHRRIRETFLQVARNEPERCVVIDAARGIEEVQQAVRNTVADRFGLDLGADRP